MNTLTAGYPSFLISFSNLYLQEEKFTSIEKGNYYCPPDNITLDIPLTIPNLIKKRRTSEDNHLLQFVGVEQLSQSHFYREVILPQIQLISDQQQVPRDSIIINIVANMLLYS